MADIVPSLGVTLPNAFDEEGRRVVRPDVLNFVMLATIAAHTSKSAKIEKALYDHEKDIEGEGLVRLMNLTISDEFSKWILPEVWQSCSITNDGQHEVYVWFNDLYTQEIRIDPYETLDHNTITHKIRVLYFKCNDGESTTVRIMGSY